MIIFSYLFLDEIFIYLKKKLSINSLLFVDFYSNKKKNANHPADYF